MRTWCACYSSTVLRGVVKESGYIELTKQGGVYSKQGLATEARSRQIRREGAAVEGPHERTFKNACNQGWSGKQTRDILLTESLARRT